MRFHFSYICSKKVSMKLPFARISDLCDDVLDYAHTRTTDNYIVNCKSCTYIDLDSCSTYIDKNQFFWCGKHILRNDGYIPHEESYF